ncbi:hypothetical protein PVAND_013463 [Polypedilum vanderplanki]|uniref:Uncharacterized protein n=1 Tax=Polypedilum vanderplanki TaxID=319348 RepID=A0A9J6CPS5_POLVA|nr:hypothetical protein PVAND_013463 [Polypedilum vanderplanki]
MLTKTVLCMCFILFTAHLIGIECFGSKTKVDKCYNHNNKLLSILNLLCNTTQNTSITVRDACYGCFFRVGVIPPGASLLSQLSQCANTYLANTSYAGCASQLATIVSGIRPTTAPTYPYLCYTGYCEFVRCIRRINANVLIDNCLLENISRNLTAQQDRVNFYTNITACILARARCNAYNPITGEVQSANNLSPLFPLQTGVLSNALQVTTTGDIRIVSFSQKVGVSGLFCATQTSLDQAGYGVTTC